MGMHAGHGALVGPAFRRWHHVCLWVWLLAGGSHCGHPRLTPSPTCCSNELDNPLIASASFDGIRWAPGSRGGSKGTATSMALFSLSPSPGSKGGGRHLCGPSCCAASGHTLPLAGRSTCHPPWARLFHHPSLLCTSPPPSLPAVHVSSTPLPGPSASFPPHCTTPTPPTAAAPCHAILGCCLPPTHPPPGTTPTSSP